jgi:hypothetical protein
VALAHSVMVLFMNVESGVSWGQGGAALVSELGGSLS